MKTMNWFYIALVTVACWGLYGIFLHAGQVGMKDPLLGRYKAFLFVGIAYFLTAVLAPLIILLAPKNMDWNMPPKGMWISLFTGKPGLLGNFSSLATLATTTDLAAAPAKLAYTAAAVGFGVYLVNLILSFFLPEPNKAMLD